MRILFLIRGMADAAAIIDKAVLAARHNPSLQLAGGSTALGVDGATEWRTLREDPFAADWTGLRARLADAPALDTTALFAHLLRRPATSRRRPIDLI